MIRNSRFDGNTARHYGGALALRKSERLIDNCIFTNNVAGLEGNGRGGALWMDGNGEMIITDSEFSENTVGVIGSTEVGTGGAVMVDGPDSPNKLSIVRCQFLGNSAYGEQARDGAIYALAGRITDCVVFRNATGDPGKRRGSVVSISPYGGEVIRCVISDNEGGGLWLSGNSFYGAQVSDSIFEGNERSGLGVSSDQAGNAVSNSLIANNGNLGFLSPAFLGKGVDVRNCTFVGNVSGSFASLKFGKSVVNSVVWGNTPTTIDGSAVYSFSCIEGGKPGIGVISRDPRFIDASGSNYRLGSVSPCVDAGDNSAVPLSFNPVDLDGNPRFVDDLGMPDSGSGAKPIVDMGAYERQEDSCYADCDQSTGAGTLDIFDFLCFQNSFVNGETYACDCDTSTGNGVCDVFDFLCFQNAFVGGCP